ncbi:alpha/beta fold hydrolase [Sinosporangium siamense]|uniref:Alpha/beta hydrolase n=1 Tax=Sinosporangium siamense TaxID=1367973 RepID=A0A919RAK3_9ACTN|nr:alpha/beta hydrolase [Sinosporangium siamense]GII89982.1 hypothetical protein Ssi02_02130 [Sinosporangium siamense]
MSGSFGTSGHTTLRAGRRLHHVTLGSGTPPVVFESGGYGSRMTWGLVQGEIARTTSTLAYDRSGFGRSDPDPTAARHRNRMLVHHVEPHPDDRPPHDTRTASSTN